MRRLGQRFPQLCALAEQVHADAEALRAGVDSGQACSPAGFETLRGNVQALACDASRVVIHDKDGNVLDVGRRTRVVPTAIRRALEHRGGCRFPGCGLRIGDAHHMAFLARGRRPGEQEVGRSGHMS